MPNCDLPLPREISNSNGTLLDPRAFQPRTTQKINGNGLGLILEASQEVKRGLFEILSKLENPQSTKLIQGLLNQARDGRLEQGQEAWPKLRETAKSMTDDQLFSGAQVLGVFATLNNQLEAAYRIGRILDERRNQTYELPMRDSFRSALFELKQKGVADEQVQTYLERGFPIRITFTKHPTENRTPEVVQKLGPMTAMLVRNPSELQDTVRSAEFQAKM